MKKANKALNIVSACLSTLILVGILAILGAGALQSPTPHYTASSKEAAIIIAGVILILYVLSGIANAIVTGLTKPQELGLNKTASIVFHAVCGGFVGLLLIILIVILEANVSGQASGIIVYMELVLLIMTCSVYSTFSIYAAVKQKV